MELTDWIVILAITLIAIGFYCGRIPARWSMKNRARRLTATRLLLQAAFALWAALLIVVRGLFVIDGLPGLALAPHTLLVGAAVLVAFGCYWSIRGRQLLKPKGMFTAY